MMLSVFSNMLTKESDLRVIDNLCAALCRLILSNVDAVPLEQARSQAADAVLNTSRLVSHVDGNNVLSVKLQLSCQVLPALVARLPLKEDLEENKTVFSCLTMLCTQSPDLVLHNLTHRVEHTSCFILKAHFSLVSKHT